MLGCRGLATLLEPLVLQAEDEESARVEEKRKKEEEEIYPHRRGPYCYATYICVTHDVLAIMWLYSLFIGSFPDEDKTAEGRYHTAGARF